MGDELKKMYVVLGLKTEDLNKGLKNAEKQFNRSYGQINDIVKKSSVAMMGFGAAVEGALVVSIKNWAEAGQEINALTQKTGFSAEAISEWKYAADNSEASITELSTATRTLSLQIVKASEGSDASQKSFENIGVTWQELKGLSPEEQFRRVALAIAAITDQNSKVAAAQDLFGKSGTGLLPLLNKGADGISALTQEAHKMGVVFTDEAARKASEFADQMKGLKTQVTGLEYEIAGQLVPAVSPWIKTLTEMIGNTKDGVKANKDFGASLAEVGLTVGGLGVALAGISKFSGAPELMRLMGGKGMTAGVGMVGGLAGEAGLGILGTGLALKYNWDAAASRAQYGAERTNEAVGHANLPGATDKEKSAAIAALKEQVGYYEDLRALGGEVNQEMAEWEAGAQSQILNYEAITNYNKQVLEYNQAWADYDKAVEIGKQAQVVLQEELNKLEAGETNNYRDLSAIYKSGDYQKVIATQKALAENLSLETYAKQAEGIRKYGQAWKELGEVARSALEDVVAAVVAAQNAALKKYYMGAAGTYYTQGYTKGDPFSEYKAGNISRDDYLRGIGLGDQADAEKAAESGGSSAPTSTGSSQSITIPVSIDGRVLGTAMADIIGGQVVSRQRVGG